MLARIRAGGVVASSDGVAATGRVVGAVSRGTGIVAATIDALASGNVSAGAVSGIAVVVTHAARVVVWSNPGLAGSSVAVASGAVVRWVASAAMASATSRGAVTVLVGRHAVWRVVMVSVSGEVIVVLAAIAAENIPTTVVESKDAVAA